MSGDKSQTTSTNSAPWPAAQPALKQGLTDATKLYKSGVGSQPYTGSTVVPYAQQTIQGMNQQQGAANAAAPAFQDNFRQVAANASNGGLNDLQRGAVDRLQPMADGSMMEGNPFLDGIIKKNADDIRNQTAQMASAAGRYGSGAHTDLISEKIGEMANTARFNNYNTERGYMQDAIGSIFNAGQQQQNNINGNAGALAGAYEGMMQPGNTLQSIGGNYEDLQGRVMNDQMRIFSEMQNAPWQQIARLNGVASGAGQMGSTGQTTAQGPSKLGSGIGGALAGYGMGGPVGGILGGLGGAFL